MIITKERAQYVEKAWLKWRRQKKGNLHEDVAREAFLQGMRAAVKEFELYRESNFKIGYDEYASYRKLIRKSSVMGCLNHNETTFKDTK